MTMTMDEKMSALRAAKVAKQEAREAVQREGLDIDGNATAPPESAQAAKVIGDGGPENAAAMPPQGLTRAQAAARRAELAKAKRPRKRPAPAPKPAQKETSIEERMLSVLRQTGLIGKDGKVAPAYRGPTRVESRVEPRRVTALNRAGQVVSRTQSDGMDKFHIDRDEIPDGWDYNWKDLNVIGRDFGHMNSYLANGWEMVPASRYPGRFAPASAGDAAIVIDGLMLMERAKVLSLDAEDHDRRKADDLIRVRNEQFEPKGLPGARSDRYRGTRLTAKRAIERMPADIDPPSDETV